MKTVPGLCLKGDSSTPVLVFSDYGCTVEAVVFGGANVLGLLLLLFVGGVSLVASKSKRPHSKTRKAKAELYEPLLNGDSEDKSSKITSDDQKTDDDFKGLEDWDGDDFGYYDYSSKEKEQYVEQFRARRSQARLRKLFALSEIVVSVILCVLPWVIVGLQAQDKVDYPLGRHSEDVESKYMPSVAWGIAAVSSVSWALSLAITVSQMNDAPSFNQILWFLLYFIATFMRLGPSFINRSRDEFESPHLGSVLLIINIAVGGVAGILGLGEWYLKANKEATRSIEEKIKTANEKLEKQKAKGAPFENSSLIGKWFFTFIDPIISAGYYRRLEPSDLLDLGERDSSQNVLKTFEEVWNKEYETRRAKGKNPRFWYALLMAFGRPFIPSAIYKTLYDVLSFVGPVVLHAVIDYLDSKKDVKRPWWASFVSHSVLGYYYVLVLVLSSVIRTVLLHQYFFWVIRIGMNFRSAIVLSVYQKSLLLAPKAKQESSTGKIVNLMSIDATRMQDLTTYVMMIISGPLQIGLSIYMLWNLLGVATLAGLGVLLALIPLNTATARMMKKYQNALVTVKDRRVHLTSEAINGIKIIKSNAWEKGFEKQIREARAQEMKKLRQYIVLRCFIFVLFGIIPTLVSLGTFGLYIGLGHELDASKAFTALALFNLLRFPLLMLPFTVNNLVEATVSLRRMQQFLSADEIDKNAVKREPARPNSEQPNGSSGHEANCAILIKNGEFSWGTDSKPDGAEKNEDSTASQGKQSKSTLTDINLEIPRGSLVCVVGPVGCGKTSLLNALLGEMDKIRGDIITRGSISYAAQNAFIMNATVKNNIVFGMPFEEERYQKALKVCSLESDLDLLPDGDETEIGEQGINLSGGQRQRIALARAVYRDADICLLDDTLSAVDAHVGAEIFEQCIIDHLSNKTRVLVTHGLQYLSRSDFVVTMSNGRISEVGTYKALTSQGSSSELSKLLAAYESEMRSISSTDDMIEESTDSDGKPVLEKLPSKKKADAAEAKSPATRVIPAKLIQEEKRSEGQVKGEVYISYMEAAGGYVLGIFIFIMFVSYAFASVLSNWYLTYWSKQTKDSDNSRPQAYYLGIYGVLSIMSVLMLLCRQLLTGLSGSVAAQRLHNSLLKGILRAPMSFFHTTPTGRIINRFSQDTYTIDEKLESTLSSYVSNVFVVLSTLGVVVFATPWFLTAIPFILYIYAYVQKIYIPTARELKRLDAIARSPIYSHFGETLSGVTTIRAYGDQERFTQENIARLDRNQKAYNLTMVSNRWLATRLETTGTLVVLGASLFSILSKGVAAGLAGLSITYALQVTQSLNWVVRMASDKENQIVAVERVREYTKCRKEPPAIVRDNRPPPAWPSQGRIEFVNVVMAYREGLPAVLNNVSFTIEEGSKVGICGRTGAGKSSILVTLLRTADVIQGKILIDGIDILDIGLEDLRSRIAIIPQEATLFSGVIRDNLDPLNLYTDDQLWNALEQVNLKEVISAEPLGLQARVAEDGDNWSMGQKQLICMARALLRNCRIILLDEATASCDVETDAMLQKTIRAAFRDCTVLTIAHRIHTIADSDKILVLGGGNVLEYDSPRELMNRPGSVYKELVEESTS